jgi:hypothetical protein
MLKLVLAILVCSILVFISCTPAHTPYEQELQPQINDLYTKVNYFSNVVSELQYQVHTGMTATSKQEDEQVSNENNIMTNNIKDLTTTVESLDTQVKALQDKLKIAETTIGAAPVTINGLSIIFITNAVITATTLSSTPNTAQFAIKITNTTDYLLSNIDVTGMISMSQFPSGSMAAGYPQIIDAAGLCSYTYFKSGSDKFKFEAYSNGKASLSIPAGSSITLRPKVSVLAAANSQLPPITFTVALNSITYDMGNQK